MPVLVSWDGAPWACGSAPAALGRASSTAVSVIGAGLLVARSPGRHGGGLLAVAVTGALGQGHVPVAVPVGVGEGVGLGVVGRLHAPGEPGEHDDDPADG